MPPTARPRSAVALTALGLLAAVWLGLTAPSVSPVSGAPPAVATTTTPAVVAPAPAPGAGGGR